MSAGPTESLNWRSVVGVPLTARGQETRAGEELSLGLCEGEDNAWSVCWLVGLVALVAIFADRAAAAQDAKGKDCRMEQQCHWKDFKKICVWVKVCR